MQAANVLRDVIEHGTREATPLVSGGPSPSERGKGRDKGGSHHMMDSAVTAAVRFVLLSCSGVGGLGDQHMCSGAPVILDLDHLFPDWVCSSAWDVPTLRAQAQVHGSGHRACVECTQWLRCMTLELTR